MEEARVRLRIDSPLETPILNYENREIEKF